MKKLNLEAFKKKITKKDRQEVENLCGDILGTCHDGNSGGSGAQSEQSLMTNSEIKRVG